MKNTADSIMEIFDNEIQQYGYTLDSIHRMSYEKWKVFEEHFHSLLRKHDYLDLSYKREYSCEYNIDLSGNFGAIIAEIYQHYFKKNWFPLEGKYISAATIENAKHFCKEDKFGHPIEITKEEFLNLLENKEDSFTNIGIGSQASVIETKNSIYEDKQGNLLFTTTQLIYD